MHLVLHNRYMYTLNNSGKHIDLFSVAIVQNRTHLRAAQILKGTFLDTLYKILFANLVSLCASFQEAARGSLPYQVSVQLNYNDRKVCMNK